MNNPCLSRVICECSENPFSNLSAEAPDVDRFFALFHFAGDPPLGDSFSQASCLTVCESTVSQEDADLCALRQAQQCVWDNPGFGGDWRTPPTIQRPNGSSVQIFSNRVQSCTTTCPDGSPFTFTVAAGQIIALSQAEADFLAYSYACQQAGLQQICLTLEHSVCCQGQFFETRINATGLGPVNNWSIIAGAVPAGMTFFGGDVAGSSVVISGTPTTLASFQFTVRVLAASGYSQTQTFTITIGAIANASTLTPAQQNLNYLETLSATGLIAPIAWTVVSGALPAGLSLNPVTGIISGTPTTIETAHFVIQAIDSST